MGEISLLLGAGFSVNQGYPTGTELNEKITSLLPDDFFICSEGTLQFKNRSDEDPCRNDSDFIYKYFIPDLINFYINNINSTFHYEEFYDYYNEILRHERIDENFNEFCNDFRKQYNTKTNNANILTKINLFFNQILFNFLVDKNGKHFYDNVHYSKPEFPGYTGFLNLLEMLGFNNIVHIHTLNHDIFFETFKDSSWLNGDLSNGYEELGSPFYGKIKDCGKIRLPYFTNKYYGHYRLYKLHGSIDQFPFHTRDSGVIGYIKTKYGIDTTQLYKEVKDENGNYKYINDWINYHSDFLSGTTSKIRRYGEPFYYMKVFSHFKKNLNNSEKLICIGYGCGDNEIDNIIESNFNFKEKTIFIVDPYPSEQTVKFINRFGAKLIMKSPENIEISDFKN